MKKDFKIMLKNLCCSKCKADFDESSINFLYKDGDYNVINLVCKNCGKDFGLAFFKINQNNPKTQTDLILNDSRNKPAINTNDVLDAHNQIKDFEKNWQNFMND